MNSKNSITEIIFVNSFKKECVGIGPMHCMLIQRADTLKPNAWEFFYDEIDGFNYEPGYIYKLKLEKHHSISANIPADASTINYTLIEIIEKNLDKRMRINDIWALTAIYNDKALVNSFITLQEHPVIEVNIRDMKIYGNDGCNSFQGDIIALNESALTFSEISSTKMACPNMEFPLLFQKALEQTSNYSIQGLELRFFDKRQQEILSFKKVD